SLPVGLHLPVALTTGEPLCLQLGKKHVSHRPEALGGLAEPVFLTEGVFHVLRASDLNRRGTVRSPKPALKLRAVVAPPLRVPVRAVGPMKNEHLAVANPKGSVFIASVRRCAAL